MEDPVIALQEGELERSALSLVDEAGTVFFWRGKVLRAVRAEAAEQMRALFASGLPAGLAERGWMPRARLTAHSLPGYALVIEQDRLPVVTYPYEWTHGMMRDAAIRVIEINQLAREHGWELKDCHGFNVVFDGSQPQWVDLGSFVPCARSTPGWPAAEEFARCYLYPLEIWADGSAFIARRLQAAAEPMTHADYGLYRWSWLRWGAAKFYQKFKTRWYHYRRFARTEDARIREKLPAPVASVLIALKTRGWLPAQEFPAQRLKARLRRRKFRPAPGFWSEYQSADAFVATPRFEAIIAQLQQFKATSVVELAGNQGRLAEELLRRGVVQSAIATDADEQAVNAAYERTKSARGALNVAVLDLIFPMVSPFGEPPARRLQADAVLALAVTHHLLLTQQIPVARVLRSIGAYSRRLVLVEFMPLGLWDGHKAPPVPSWYTLEWFRAEFSRQFELLHDQPVETNRHLFCGRIRSGPGSP